MPAHTNRGLRHHFHWGSTIARLWWLVSARHDLLKKFLIPFWFSHSDFLFHFYSLETFIWSFTGIFKVGVSWDTPSSSSSSSSPWTLHNAEWCRVKESVSVNEPFDCLSRLLSCLSLKNDAFCWTWTDTPCSLFMSQFYTLANICFLHLCIFCQVNWYSCIRKRNSVQTFHISVHLHTANMFN